MSKSPDAFRTISEVADWLGVQAHVLRFWESKFAQVKPVKRAGGRRYYRPADMLLLGGIKKLLHDDGLTIKGAQKLIREQGVTEVSALSQPLDAGPSETYEAEPAGGTVLRFTGAAEEAAGSAAPAAADPVPPAPRPRESERFAASLDLGPDPAPPPEAPPEAIPEAPPEGAAETPPEARLPAFLHRTPPAPDPAGTGAEAGASDGVSTTETAAEPKGETAAAPARARIVEAPDPPAEAGIDTAPGLLAAVSSLSRLPSGLAEEIAPVLADLARLVARRGPARAG